MPLEHRPRQTVEVPEVIVQSGRIPLSGPGVDVIYRHIKPASGEKVLGSAEQTVTRRLRPGSHGAEGYRTASLAIRPVSSASGGQDIPGQP
jgi:hypothetical protein